METFQLTVTWKMKRWRFPAGRFVSLDSKDESWCRFFGVGHAIETEEIVMAPNAYIENISSDGRITIRAIPIGGGPMYTVA